MMDGVEQNPGPRPRPVVPPRFITEIEDQNSMLGDTWNLNVSIEGDSPFNVKVLKDTIELPAIGHVEYSCDNDVVCISIEDVELTDEGSYQIEVSNGSGVTASCTFNITVREEVQTVKCPPFAESITEGDIRLEKAVGESVSLEEVIAKVKTYKTSIQIPSPCSGVIESFLVNDGDTVEAGAQICTINVEVPLRFKKVRKNQNYNIQLGETWKNYLQIVGDGPFNVKVTKDTIELPATGHMEYSCDNNVVRISIEDVEVTDEGSYQIEVSNGSRLNAFCTFKITVLRYNFRYQYLLVETGTMVLRKLFESKVGNDLASYLSDTSSLQWKALQSLLKGKNGVRKLYDDQAALLPPRNSKPTSEKFDISLLNRLLKHICNPKDPNDPEQNREPTPEEKLEEDYIASLTDCRDNLSHSGTVRFPATELADKWNELTNILLQLNKFCGENKIPDLNDKIDRVKDMVIDEATENTLKEKIKYWHEKIDLKKDIARVEDKVHRVDDKLDTLLQETRANKMTIQTMNVINQETLNVSSGSKNRPDDIMVINQETLNVSSGSKNRPDDIMGRTLSTMADENRYDFILLYEEENSDDENTAKEILDRLEEQQNLKGYASFRDATLWKTRFQNLEHAVTNSRYIFVLISNSSVQDKWWEHETQTSLFYQIEKRREALVPIYLPGLVSDIPMCLSTYKGVNFDSQKFWPSVLRLFSPFAADVEFQDNVVSAKRISSKQVNVTSKY